MYEWITKPIEHETITYCILIASFPLFSGHNEAFQSGKCLDLNAFWQKGKFETRKISITTRNVRNVDFCDKLTEFGQ